MAKKDVKEVKVEEVKEEIPVQPHVVYHKERWDNDSGVNQLVSDSLPSLND